MRTYFGILVQVEEILFLVAILLDCEVTKFEGETEYLVCVLCRVKERWNQVVCVCMCVYGSQVRKKKGCKTRFRQPGICFCGRREFLVFQEEGGRGRGREGFCLLLFTSKSSSAY